MTGTLFVYSQDALVLFDSSSTHSYVSPIFAKHFSKELSRLEKPFLMATPIGETLLVQYGFVSVVYRCVGGILW